MSADDWHIARLTLENFRNYENLTIELGRSITLLIGENGAGKTSILDALAALLWTPLRQLSGDGRGARHIRPTDARRTPSDLDSRYRTSTVEQHYPVLVKAEGELGGQDFSWERELGSADGRTTWGGKEVRDFCGSIMDRAVSADDATDDVTLPVLAYYGVERLVREVPQQGAIQLSRRGAYDLTLDPRSDLKRLFVFLESLDEQIVRAHAYNDPEPTAARQQFEAVEAACDRVLEPVGWHRMRWNSEIREVTFHHDEHGTLPLTMLATGTKIAAGLTIDLASRMARANPHLGAGDLLEETPGIVLIDEVDLHLHPTWQQRIVPALRRTFPRVQFVLTTHSPQVISTVEAESIRILDNSDVSTPEFSEGLRSNVILDRLQRTDPRPDVPMRANLDEYLDLVNAGEGRSKRALKLRGELDRVLGGAELNRELVDADTIIAVESWED